MGRLYVRSYFLVVLFAIFLTVVMVLGIQNNWGIFRQPSKEQVLNPDARNLAAFDEGAIDVASVDLIFTVTPPSSGEENRELAISLDGAYFYVRDDSEELDVAEVCFLPLFTNVNPARDTATTHEFTTESNCFTPDYANLITETVTYENAWSIDNYFLLDVLPSEEALNPLNTSDASLINVNFFYPYDTIDLNLQLDVSYFLTLSDGTTLLNSIQPYVAWDLNTSGKRNWDIRLSSKTTPYDYTFEETNETVTYTYEDVTMLFERPLLYRLIFPFFIVMMVLLIGLVPLLGDKDTLVDISAAMLFGIFGLKGILGPGDEMGRTILDIALIMLYVLLAFAGFLFFLNRIRDMRNEANNTSES